MSKGFDDFYVFKILYFSFSAHKFLINSFFRNPVKRSQVFVWGSPNPKNIRVVISGKQANCSFKSIIFYNGYFLRFASNPFKA